LVLAGILAAAMSTLSSSLNALASSTMLDVLAHVKRYSSAGFDSLRASRWLTLLWAAVFVFFATLFQDRRNPVVELGLSIASFTYGALLGAFLLGMWNERVREKQAMVAFVLSVVVMIFLIFGFWIDADGGWHFVLGPTPERIAAEGLRALAWPWYTCVGAAITVFFGSLTAFRHR
jgi:Na+/proline symporter